MGVLHWFKKQGRLPNFFIIGAQKGGTSSLHGYLQHHPNLFLSQPKELHYFDLFYDKGLNWYKEHFITKDANKVHFGESTPFYLYHPGVPHLMKDLVPNAKFIVLLRNPVERAFSQYQMEFKRGTEHLDSFEKALDAEKERLANTDDFKLAKTAVQNSEHAQHSYFSRGLYAKQIAHWFSIFQKEQFLFLKSEDFFANPKEVLIKVYQFLGVDTIYPANLKALNTGNYSPLSKEELQRYSSFFAEDHKELIKLIGEDFTWDY